MAIATEMVCDGIELTGVIGRVFRPSVRVRVSEALDGSSLDLNRNQHQVSFTLQNGLLARLKPVLQLNDLVSFSANYSSGEKVRGAQVLVKSVELTDSDDIAYTLLVNSNEAILDESSPG